MSFIRFGLQKNISIELAREITEDKHRPSYIQVALFAMMLSLSVSLGGRWDFYVRFRPQMQQADLPRKTTKDKHRPSFVQVTPLALMLSLSFRGRWDFYVIQHCCQIQFGSHKPCKKGHRQQEAALLAEVHAADAADVGFELISIFTLNSCSKERGRCRNVETSGFHSLFIFEWVAADVGSNRTFCQMSNHFGNGSCPGEFKFRDDRSRCSCSVVFSQIFFKRVFVCRERGSTSGEDQSSKNQKAQDNLWFHFDVS